MQRILSLISLLMQQLLLALIRSQIKTSQWRDLSILLERTVEQILVTMLQTHSIHDLLLRNKMYQRRMQLDDTQDLRFLRSTSKTLRTHSQTFSQMRRLQREPILSLIRTSLLLDLWTSLEQTQEQTQVMKRQQQSKRNSE